MMVNKISMPHTNINYKNETNEISLAVNLKNELLTFFIKAEGCKETQKKGKMSSFKNDVMTDVSVESIISKINVYILESSGSKYNRFLKELKYATRNNKLTICDKYDFLKVNNNKYQFSIKAGMRPDAVLSTESCSNAASVDHEKINLARESVRCAENKLMKLIDLYYLAQGLLVMHCRIFEYNMFQGKGLTINKDIIFKDSMSGEHDLAKLQLRCERMEKLAVSYDTEINMNMRLLPDFNKNLVIVCETSPDALELINSLLPKLLNKHDTLWTRFVNAIASVLFPDLFQDKENGNIQTAKDLLELKGLITALRKKTGYDRVVQTNWLYGLVTQILVKGTPAQYPFDPLNILSPDRKVWLALQKEWPVLLKPKSTEPEPAQ
ncbi:hypothetical protein [Yersinia intermedia]|uniref:hypothetical protein n=2 Tax=Yersinia intermedia TaxID=631 RepID=UPI00119F4B61|nr:hypothetical protein [Yersinia intermedia]MCW8111557.1 hypothetical protein [Yersinia intermedia]MDA5516232.1 hypothetical protein [Yersinia intermedia]MDN0114915.1 hypothetical protein [Yersinia intermedia]